jgi:tetratricopeptide (TPR) repeat protein
VSAEAVARALAAHRAGRFDEAESIYRALLAADAGNFDALHLLGVISYQRGRLEEAERLVSQALQVHPESAEALSNMGIVLHHLKRHAEALACYAKALERRPHFSEARYNRANLLRDIGRREEALAEYARVVQEKPDYADAWNGHGIVLHMLKRNAEALASFDRVIGLRPDHFEAWNNRGVLLRSEERFDEALACYARALQIRPGYPEAFNNQGQVMDALGRYEEALQCYGRALALAPYYVDANTNEGLCLLVMGRYLPGWEKYEWRWRNHTLNRRDYPQPLWDGTASLQGKSILLHMEQGLGDAIQVARYAPLVAALGGRVVLEVVPALAPLLEGLEGVDQVITDKDPLPHTDYRCPLLSLPRAFRTTLETIPARIPYLHVDPARAAEQRRKIAPGGGKLVGLCWRGNPEYPRDRERSFGFERLAPLFGMDPGIRFVSLQKELLESEQAQAAGLRDLVHPGLDFRSTAELVAALDLVITVDTSWGHWAGAIGKPFWMLLPFSPHWVWLTGRADSPWYPTARLFRQSRSSDWAGVIEEVKKALASSLNTV